MLEASAILGSRCPGALFATKTPGIDVVLIAICPVLATTVPGAGLPFATEADPEAPPAACAAPLPLLLGLEEPAAWDPFMGPLPVAEDPLADAAPPGGEID
jgi:hypothetical protein